jgi:hypothetical protein
MTAKAALAEALIESDLIQRYSEYAIDAHEFTMAREGFDVLADQWAAAILAAMPGWTLARQEDLADDTWFIAAQEENARLRAALLVVAGNPAITSDTMRDIARSALSEGGSDAE